MALNVEKVKRGAVGKVTTKGAGGIAPDELFAAWVAGPAAVPVKSMRAGLQAVLFDLDGVLVDTAVFHYAAWKRLADELGVAFDERVNHGFRGVGRMECLEKLLGKYGRGMAGSEKLVLAERKNGYYLEQVMRLGPDDVAAGARGLAMRLRASGVRMAVVSASKNARLVLGLLGITDWFDAIVDGGMVSRGKPDPMGFLLAARILRAEAEQCVVVEDAEAGIIAGHAAEMVCVGIGNGAVGADVTLRGVGELTVEGLEEAWRKGGE